jgi:hypothetical protein
LLFKKNFKIEKLNKEKDGLSLYYNTKKLFYAEESVYIKNDGLIHFRFVYLFRVFFRNLCLNKKRCMPQRNITEENFGDGDIPP